MDLVVDGIPLEADRTRAADFRCKHRSAQTLLGMLLHDGQNVPDIEVRPEASALIYTMVEMARANGVNVYQYLTYLLEKCPTSQTSDEELEKLAPWDPEVKRITGERSEAL